MCESESEVAQPHPTLCDLMDCSLSGSSVHGIFQARVLERVAIAFSRHMAIGNSKVWAKGQIQIPTQPPKRTWVLPLISGTGDPWSKFSATRPSYCKSTHTQLHTYTHPGRKPVRKVSLSLL